MATNMSLPALSLDTEFSLSPFILPSLVDDSAVASRHAGRRVSGRNSRIMDASSAPLQSRHDTGPRSPSDEERISSLDPRRLTPNLHATLVSEILNLRHELQAKGKEMLELEESFSSSRKENDRLNNLVMDHVKDAKNLKHQMRMLEGGTMSAIDEMATERDRAVEQVTDLKKRLESSQSKLRQQADDAKRTHSLWESDQEKWNLQRRALDHKATIAEGRLQVVLKEFEALQQLQQRKRAAEASERPASRASRASGTRSAASMRRDSSASSDGGRRTRLSHISEIERPQAGVTLADELALDDDYDAEDDLGIVEPASPEALPEEFVSRQRPFSAQSHRQSAKAFKLLGLTREGAEVEEVLSHARDHDARRSYAQHLSNMDSDSQSQYSDNATQYSPPPTPKALGIQTLDTITEASSLYTLDDTSRDQRISEIPPLPTMAASVHQRPLMVSAGVQTAEPPLSPPDTPSEPKEPMFSTPTVPRSQMKNIATQTNDNGVGAAEWQQQGTGPALEVPVIAIHRPHSSQSDRGVVLPPHTKSISCQAFITVPVRSVAMQTEEIRIDQRPVKLPPHLLPSAISSKPSSPVPDKRTNGPHEAQHPRLKIRTSSPLSGTPGKRVSRDSKLDSIDRTSPQDDIADGYVSDDSFITREPVKRTFSRVQDTWQVVSLSRDERDDEQTGTAVVFGSSIRGGEITKSQGLKENKAGKILQVNTAKADGMRRSALVASGSAAHIQRARSPSLPTLPSTQTKRVEPPFPVPDRSSSRKFPWEGSDGGGSPTLQTVSFFGGDHDGRRQQRPPGKKPGLRKIRSETAEAYGHVRHRSRSPPPTSASSYMDLDSPGINAPPLPNDDITSPFRVPPSATHKRGNDSVALSAASSSATTDSIHVVDAIAQTMIGEWMWKYTRRRKSFGLSTTDDFDARGRDGDTLRHQRWVWLAPCERAILWSSKQPVSSIALQGKLGHRKLEIQSVLDVRDDAPMPRGAEPASCFGRSILILTPQRALKFTAMSRERHYLWLSALSFLSQPGVVPSDLGGMPPVPSLAEFTAPAPVSRGEIQRKRELASSSKSPRPAETKPATAFLRRHPVRDSIRVAKDKSRPTFSNGGRRVDATATSEVVPSVPTRFNKVHEQPEGSDPGCEPPHVPRTAAHTRKRSNTGPKSATSFRSLGSSKSASLVRGSRWGTGENESVAEAFSAGKSSRYSSMVRGSAGPVSPASTNWPDGAPPVPTLGSHRSATSSLISGGSGGLPADAHSTVRMDAFVHETLGASGPQSARIISKMPKVPWREPMSAGAVDGHGKGRRLDVGRLGLDPFAGF